MKPKWEISLSLELRITQYASFASRKLIFILQNDEIRSLLFSKVFVGNCWDHIVQKYDAARLYYIVWCHHRSLCSRWVCWRILKTISTRQSKHTDVNWRPGLNYTSLSTAMHTQASGKGIQNWPTSIFGVNKTQNSM